MPYRRWGKNQRRCPWDSGNDLVLVTDLIVKAETEKAFGIAIDERRLGWLAKSQLKRSTLVVGEQGSAVMPRWLAEIHLFMYDEYRGEPLP